MDRSHERPARAGWRLPEKRGDEGFFVPFDTLTAIRSLRRLAPRWVVPPLAAGALLGLAALPEEAKHEPFAKIDKAEKHAEVSLIEFDPTHKLSIARAYFHEVLTVENIDAGIVIDSPVVDVIPDVKFNENKQLDGIGVVSYEMLLDALSQSVDPKTNKITITIDASKVQQTRYWAGAGPEIKDFTINSGGKNFDDRSGFRKSLIADYAAVAQLFNLNQLPNDLDDLDAAINHDLRQAGLELFAERCNGELDEALRRELVGVVRELVEKLGRDGDVADVVVSDDELKWHNAKDPANLPRLREGASYRLGTIKVDDVSCTVDPSVAGVAS